MTKRRAFATLAMLLAVELVSSCQKKEEAATAPSAVPPPPPPAVSVAPLKEPEPAASVPAPAASEAPAAAAIAAVPTAPITNTEPKKPVPGGDLTGCCAAIAALAKKPGNNQNRYTTASAICSGLEKAVKSGKANFASAKATLKLQLAGAPAVSGC